MDPERDLPERDAQPLSSFSWKVGLKVRRR
jgi:hypothetical protein